MIRPLHCSQRRRAGLASSDRSTAVRLARQSASLPPVGPERPFAPAPRVERTLSNGLRVIALRHATVPKVTAMLDHPVRSRRGCG